MANENKRAVVGGVNMPIGLHSIILARFMKEKELKSLWDAYNAAKLKLDRNSGPPTDLQVKMAKMRKAGKRTREVSLVFGVSYATVQNAINRVSVWDYLNG